MKIEISAGGVVFKFKNKKPYVLLLKDKNGNWTFPKGLIEKGEDPKITAKREIQEEVGLKEIIFKDTLTPILYWYKLEGQLIKKNVFYFLFEEQTDEEPKPQKEEGIKEVKWLPIEKAIKIIGYPKTNRKILGEVKTILENKYNNNF